MKIIRRRSRQAIQCACAAGKQRKGEPCCIHIVLVLGGAVGADLFFLGEAQAVFAVQVPSVAGEVGTGAIATHSDVLLDALVLGAVQEVQGAVRRIGGTWRLQRA